MPFGLVHSSVHVYVKGKKSFPSGKIFHRGFFLFFYDDDLCRALDYTNQPTRWFFGDYYYFSSSSLPNRVDSLRRLLWYRVERAFTTGNGMPCSAVYSITIKSQMEERIVTSLCNSSFPPQKKKKNKKKFPPELCDDALKLN